jgi:hypothetical protein
MMEMVVVTVHWDCPVAAKSGAGQEDLRRSIAPPMSGGVIDAMLLCYQSRNAAKKGSHPHGRIRSR